MQEKDFAIVYSGNIAEADLLKCLLDGERIQTFLEDEFIAGSHPTLHPQAVSEAVKVLVTKSDVREARLIVEEFVNTA